MRRFDAVARQPLLFLFLFLFLRDVRRQELMGGIVHVTPVDADVPKMENIRISFSVRLAPSSLLTKIISAGTPAPTAVKS